MQYAIDLEAVFIEIMNRWDVPGMAVGIVEGGEIAYTEGFGVQSLETCAPVTLDSIFCVQSISKCFVATAILQQVECGNLELDAPLARYLPYFQIDDERYHSITIRQALSHTSGMPDMDEYAYFDFVANPEVDERSGERYVRSLRDTKLIANPGERFSYSNIAYNVLGNLLAQVSGQTFESLLQENILIRSGMPDSTFLPSDIPSHSRARPHLRSPEMRPLPIDLYHRADAPASFLHTTVVDLCHWCITCLNRGAYAGRRILSPAGYERMWTPVAPRGNPPSLFEQMGLGWSLGHFKNVKTVCHGGGGFGWTAILLILPEANCGAVVLCNEESNAHLRAVYAAADALIGLKPRANTASWMVPVSRALAAGGVEAAHARYLEIKDRADLYYFGQSDLVDLSLQLLFSQKIDLAIEVLGLNIQVFPENIDSYLGQARLYRMQGSTAQARQSLLQALSIEPENADGVELLRKLDEVPPDA